MEVESNFDSIFLSSAFARRLSRRRLSRRVYSGWRVLSIPFASRIPKPPIASNRDAVPKKPPCCMLTAVESDAGTVTRVMVLVPLGRGWSWRIQSSVRSAMPPHRLRVGGVAGRSR